MSCNKGKHNHIESSQRIDKKIKSEKKDVVERFLSILWRKEVDFKFSTKQMLLIKNIINATKKNYSFVNVNN